MKRGKEGEKEEGEEEGKAMQPSCTEPNPMGKERRKEKPNPMGKEQEKGERRTGERRKEKEEREIFNAKVAKGQESV